MKLIAKVDFKNDTQGIYLIKDYAYEGTIIANKYSSCGYDFVVWIKGNWHAISLDFFQPISAAVMD